MTVITEEGGFIGAKPDWFGKRSGVWSLQDQYDLQKNYRWPIPLGTEIAGGYFGGYITYNTNGSDSWLSGSATASYLLIVAPKASGESSTTLQYKTSATCDGAESNQTSSQSVWDGYHNTYNSVVGTSSVHPAANFCQGLNIAGYTDWYLPAQREATVAFGNLDGLPLWASNGSEEFERSGSSVGNVGLYWHSTGDSCENTGTLGGAGAFYIDNFSIAGYSKTETFWVRAIRRIPYPI